MMILAFTKTDVILLVICGCMIVTMCGVLVIASCMLSSRITRDEENKK